MENTLFEQIAEILGAPISQVSDNPLSEVACIATNPPIFLQANERWLPGKIEASVKWPNDTRDPPKERNYSIDRGAKVLAKAILRDVVQANADRYAEEMARANEYADNVQKQKDAAERLARVSGGSSLDKGGFWHRNMSGRVSLGGGYLYVDYLTLTIEQAEKVLAMLSAEDRK